MTPQEILKQYYGHTNFREGQLELINAILSGRDCLGIMPTGAGKSVCFQIPAMLLDGITIVISPLISLMKDQTEALTDMGVNVACINSSLSSAQYSQTMHKAYLGEYKILYVAPERLLSSGFLEFANQANISMVTIDEAHCVSQWGQDFRPSYLKILDFVSCLVKRPIVSAFTATATKVVRDDIVEILRLENPYLLTTGFDRKNLYFDVKQTTNKYNDLISVLKKIGNKNGIVYCLARKTVEKVCTLLNKDGYEATRYHAGLSAEERRNNQDDFLFDKKTIMVATNAFGMGIDKSNVSFVVHYNMPKNIESYYQEAGRAGRDGENAQCIILYSKQDVRTNKFLIENSNESEELTIGMRNEIIEKDLNLLKQMTFYCTTQECLRNWILKYFGDKSVSYCGNCSSCLTNYETIDITIEAQKILSCVYRISQRRRSFGKIMITDVLRGAKNEKVIKNGLDTLSTYALMSDVSTKRIILIMDFLIERGYLFVDDMNYSVVKLNEKSLEILKDRISLEMKIPVEKKEKTRSIDTGHGNNLMEKLKKTRLKLAYQENVPAYIVFSDATLKDMCGKKPETIEDFLEVAGVGKRKAEKYGSVFCEVIKEYLREA
ncbi:MAG: DNA helicase RecQ [Clostridiales bacterium]|nr:DNA helicase RecQ [Clostridiales bacterium]